MNTRFLEDLFEKHSAAARFPPTSAICKLTTKTLLLLFPEQSKKHFENTSELQAKFDDLEKELAEMLGTIKDRLPNSPAEIARIFFSELPRIYDLLLTDIDAIMQGDPAATSEYEIIRAYPGFYAIAFFRFANGLHKLGIPLLPRVVTEYAHSKTGIDIHPGATIDSYFFIDHGTGIVIGETANIGRHVKIYQGVTLGALSVEKKMANSKRHPTIEDHVVIYSGATILGGETVIGANSIVGGNVWLTRSLPPNSTVYHQAQIKVSNEQNKGTVNS